MLPDSQMKIVHKVEEGMDPSEILCTTYQMRDMYTQLGTGFYTSLDVMNYIQHHAAILGAHSGDRVLDVCCGRCLLLPLLRFYRPKIRHYVGVDIEPKNYQPAFKVAGTTKIGGKRFALNTPGAEEPFYPFAVDLLQGNVAELSSVLALKGWSQVDYIVYTASIEHMQKTAGVQSLVECWSLLKPGGRMFISTPNTEGDPYETQYAAHLYEWSLQELLEEVKKVGFQVEGMYGLTFKMTGFLEKLEEYYPEYLGIWKILSGYLPKEWAAPCFAPLVPLISDEVALKVYKP